MEPFCTGRPEPTGAWPPLVNYLYIRDLCFDAHRVHSLNLSSTPCSTAKVLPNATLCWFVRRLHIAEFRPYRMEPQSGQSSRPSSSTFDAIHDWATTEGQPPSPSEANNVVNIEQHVDKRASMSVAAQGAKSRQQKSAIISSIFTYKDRMYSVSLTNEGIAWSRQSSSGSFSILKIHLTNGKL
jgi:hypothetical protein